MAEEAMGPRSLAVADVATGGDDFGDGAVPLGKNQSRDDGDEGLVGRGGVDGRVLEQLEERGGKFQIWVPCQGVVTRASSQ